MYSVVGFYIFCELECLIIPIYNICVAHKHSCVSVQILKFVHPQFFFLFSLPVSGMFNFVISRMFNMSPKRQLPHLQFRFHNSGAYCSC